MKVDGSSGVAMAECEVTLMKWRKAGGTGGAGMEGLEAAFIHFLLHLLGSTQSRLGGIAVSVHAGVLRWASCMYPRHTDVSLIVGPDFLYHELPNTGVSTWQNPS